jgi:hypothetical protein
MFKLQEKTLSLKREHSALQKQYISYLFPVYLVSGSRRAKMTHKSEENSSFEVLDVLL